MAKSTAITVRCGAAGSSVTSRVVRGFRGHLVPVSGPIQGGPTREFKPRGKTLAGILIENVVVAPFISGIVNMSRERRLAMTTEEENFQVWLEKNWDRPLSDEVERLQVELKGLETMHAADIRRLRRAESEWWGLLRKAFLACMGLVALLLWYMNSYSEMRGALKDACAFIAREASAKSKEGGTVAKDPKQVNSVCNETPL
jgi:hypothetical protein